MSAPSLTLLLITLFQLGAVALALADPRPVASPKAQGGKSVSIDIEGREFPAEPVPVHPLSPGEPPGASSSQLSPGNQSLVGAGFQIRFGEGAKEPRSIEDRGLKVRPGKVDAASPRRQFR